MKNSLLKTIYIVVACGIIAGVSFIATAHQGQDHTYTNYKQDSYREASVSIEDNFFDGRITIIPEGTTVHWKNNGNDDHTVTADNDSFDSGRLNSGESYSRTFTRQGVYDYHCDFHNGMRGKIIVEEQSYSSKNMKHFEYQNVYDDTDKYNFRNDNHDYYMSDYDSNNYSMYDYSEYYPDMYHNNFNEYDYSNYDTYKHGYEDEYYDDYYSQYNYPMQNMMYNMGYHPMMWSY